MSEYMEEIEECKEIQRRRKLVLALLAVFALMLILGAWQGDLKETFLNGTMI